jgi:TetR/AcrR family transcriptional regulator, ethionamide resistance regulator
MPSVTRPPQHNRARRESVRAQVLEATERLLRQGESFTSLGVARIALEAGVSRSAFYTNFADKTELLLALTAASTESLFSAAFSWIHSELDDGVDELARTHMTTISVFRQHAAVLSAYVEVASYDTHVADFWTARINELVSGFAARIERGQEGGMFKRSLSPLTTASFIVLGTERVTTLHVRSDDGSGDEQLAYAIAEAVRAMLIADQAEAR